MIKINPSRFKTPPFKHQLEGIAALVKNESFALFDEMGAGKSKQVVDAACVLAAAGKIDTVVIVTPASVRCVWTDPEIGEIRKHHWIPSRVIEFHAKPKCHWSNISGVNENAEGIDWYVTNYEFLRSGERLKEFMKYVGKCTLLVLDESSYIKSRTAQQTKAIMKLRQLCDRCVILNGTPITQSPLDLWSQMQVLDKRILGAAFKDNFYYFRSEYCELVNQRFGQHSFKKVIGYKRLDDLAKRVVPYVLRREKKDCLDLPPKLYTEREVALTPASWKRYQELKKDALLTLGNGDKHLEPNAAVRIMRLAQLTSGHLGRSSGQFGYCIEGAESQTASMEIDAVDLSDEKLRWAVQYLTEECTAKAVIVWTRWRRERERLVQELKYSIAAGCRVGGVYELYGGQKNKERDQAVNLFATYMKYESDKQIVLVAQQHAGGFGLNLVAASEAIYLSNDFALGIRLQSEDRMHRPGQRNPCLYVDVLATGPKGERTIDHVIFKALREKQNLADVTTAQWRKELSDD